jgi:hypothetical protein
LLSFDEPGGSFVATEESYRVVRELQLRNAIVPLTGDFAGQHSLATVGRYLGQRGIVVNAFYASDVEQVLGVKQRQFCRNIQGFPANEQSVFIRQWPAAAIDRLSNC